MLFLTGTSHKAVHAHTFFVLEITNPKTFIIDVLHIKRRGPGDIKTIVDRYIVYNICILRHIAIH